MSEPNEESKAVPKDIRDRLMEWRKLWTDSAKIHYAFGGLSVAASSVAAAVGGDTARYLAAAAAVLTALIGFVQPERRYLKFVRAWRVLDVAVLKFKLDLIGTKDLVDALERGEALISEFEAKSEFEVKSEFEAKKDS